MNIIGVGGYARCGKDTFVSIARKILYNNGYTSDKLSFAGALKDDLDEWLKDKYGISAWTTDDKEKILIRPFFVAHGCGKRIQTEGKYWVDKVDAQIQQQLALQERDQYQDSIDVFFISDVRFLNEANWVHDKWKGEIIHLRRYTRGVSIMGVDCGGTNVGHYTKEYDPAPNDEELKQDPFVVDIADQNIEWENKGKLTADEALDHPYLNQVVLDALNKSKFFNGKLHL